MEGETALIAAAFVAVAVCILVRILIPVLSRRGVMDRPNARSSHTVPTPRGGGIAMMAVLLPALFGRMIWAEMPVMQVVAVVGGAAVLALVSLVDDVLGLGAASRFGAQVIVIGSIIASVLIGIGGAAPWFSLLVLLALPAWIWFVNLYNFMDGIDGITAVETLVIGLGLAFLTYDTGQAGRLFMPAVFVSAAALGFLIWNWHPAKIFMGDVGSVPLGFILGWMLLRLAESGLWAAALILSSYYLTDATLTLLRRILRGEKFWRAHKEHFYQRAVQAGRSHSQVSLAVALAGVLLIALAWWSTQDHEWQALGAAAVVVILLMAWMSPRRIEPAETGT